MLRVIPQMRGRDAQGAGYFGASRGGRPHEGQDFVASTGHYVQLSPGDPVLALDPGTVTRLGHPYPDDPATPENELELYDLIEVTHEDGFVCRYLYVEPRVKVGDRVQIGDLLGLLQGLPYQDMEPHYHFDVARPDGRRVDPIRYLSGDIR